MYIIRFKKNTLMMHRLIPFIFFIFLFFSACKKEKKRPDQIYLLGTVINKQTEAPIEGATIRLFDHGTFSLFSSPTSGTTLQTSTTNNSGSFHIQFTPPKGEDSKNKYTPNFLPSYYLEIKKDSFKTIAPILVNYEQATQVLSISLEK
jgi:hypothetical protein